MYHLDRSAMQQSSDDVPECHVCRHIPRLYDFLWVAEDGMKMQGYNGSQLWDTTFAVQAICATGLAHEFSDCLRRAHNYVDVTQASKHDFFVMQLLTNEAPCQ